MTNLEVSLQPLIRNKIEKILYIQEVLSIFLYRLTKQILTRLILGHTVVQLALEISHVANRFSRKSAKCQKEF